MHQKKKMNNQEFQLQAEDVVRLYGDRFYVVSDEDVAVTAEAPAETRATTPEVAEVGETSPEKPAEKPVEKTAEKPTEAEEAAKVEEKDPGIIWRPKETSKVLFILHQSELKDKELTDLLKKIVQSIEIPFESAGFGIIVGEVRAEDFQAMPNPMGVIFDQSLNNTNENPAGIDGKTIWFTHRLAELKDNRDYKLALWESLKVIKKNL